MPKAVECAAEAGSKLGINIEETMFGAFPDGNGGKENFVSDHISLSKMLQMMCCPACCLYVPYVSKKRRIEFVKECGCCACPYAVNLNDKQVGKVHDVKCMDNGCMFCCCPILTCGGKIKLMGIHGADGNEKFVFAKELFPCWPIVQAFSMFCTPLGACCVSLCGCYNYCQGTEVRTITQPVFKGPWSRTDGGDPEKLGDFIITQRFYPVGVCFAMPSPLTYYYKPSSATGGDLSPEDLAALALPLALYRGLPAPCKCCSSATFQMPMGIPCTDIGLMTETSWATVQKTLVDAD